MPLPAGRGETDGNPAGALHRERAEQGRRARMVLVSVYREETNRVAGSASVRSMIEIRAGMSERKWAKGVGGRHGSRLRDTDMFRSAQPLRGEGTTVVASTRRVTALTIVGNTIRQKNGRSVVHHHHISCAFSADLLHIRAAVWRFGP